MVAGAVIEGPEGLLLVQNRRRSGVSDWSTPGGVIDAGETVIEGLSREVTEETGLVVSAWSGPLYRVEVAAPGFGWNLQVEVHAADAFDGDLTVDDPDGIVVDARFVGDNTHVALLESNHRWVGEPLCEWFDARWDHEADRRLFRYQLEGDRPRDVVVTRHPQ